MTRLLISLFLSLLLATTSVTSATMHAQMQGAIDLVICSDGAVGAATATVTLDATGRPITQKHACPDCLAAKGVALLTAFVPPFAPQTGSQRIAVPVILPATGQPAPQAVARGPPITFA